MVGLRVYPGLLKCSQGAPPGHFVAPPTLLASEPTNSGAVDSK